MITLACCSDTHGAVPPPIASGNIAAWLHAGDLYDGSEPTRGAAELQAWISRQKVPVLAVRGNHDVDDAANFFRDARDITGSVCRVAEGLWIAGVGWHGAQYDEVPTQNEMDDICAKLHQQILHEVGSKDRLIIITHYPADVPDAPDWPGGAGGYAAIEACSDPYRKSILGHRWSNQLRQGRDRPAFFVPLRFVEAIDALRLQGYDIFDN